MWNGSGDGEAGRYSCACGCSVHSAAESTKDSVRFFTISELAARLFATVRKTEGCSVDISIDAAAAPDIVCDSVTGKARAAHSFSPFPERPGLVVAILRPNLLRVKYDRGKSKRQGRKIPALVFGTEAAAESRTRAFIPAPAAKTENIFLPVPIIPHSPCNRKAPAQSNEQVLIKPLFFQDHRTLGGDGGLDELGGILGGEEQLLAALHILHGAQAFFNLVLSKKNGIGDP